MQPPGPNPLAEAIIARVLERGPACGRTRVLAIDGPSGSGKTSLAADIRELSGATVLHLEDLYRGWHGLESAPPAAAAILAAVAVDEIGRAPGWDWERGTTGAEMTVVPSELLVVEGVGAGARQSAPFVSLLIWLDGPEPERRARAMARDGEVYEPWWDVWAAQEKQHFLREGTRARADLRLTSDA